MHAADIRDGRDHFPLHGIEHQHRAIAQVREKQVMALRVALPGSGTSATVISGNRLVGLPAWLHRGTDVANARRTADTQLGWKSLAPIFMACARCRK